MTAVAMVQLRTIWLDDYFPTLQERFGERPFMVTEGRDGQPVNVTPFAPSVLTLPAVLVFDLAGTAASGWETWMEAGMLTAALTAALSVLVLFLLITRLTTRRRVFLVASAYAFGTLTWGVAGQALGGTHPPCSPSRSRSSRSTTGASRSPEPPSPPWWRPAPRPRSSPSSCCPSSAGPSATGRASPSVRSPSGWRCSGTTSTSSGSRCARDTRSKANRPRACSREGSWRG